MCSFRHFQRRQRFLCHSFNRPICIERDTIELLESKRYSMRCVLTFELCALTHSLARWFARTHSPIRSAMSTLIRPIWHEIRTCRDRMRTQLDNKYNAMNSCDFNWSILCAMANCVVCCWKHKNPNTKMSVPHRHTRARDARLTVAATLERDHLHDVSFTSQVGPGRAGLSWLETMTATH